jgi:hypothetical protein
MLSATLTLLINPGFCLVYMDHRIEKIKAISRILFPLYVKTIVVHGYVLEILI